MATNLSDFRAEMRAASEPQYMTEKSDIIEHYKDTYGESGWQNAIKEVMGSIATNKNGDLLSRGSLNRRFNGGREMKAPNAKQKEEYRQLGETLPPIGYNPPESGFTINFEGEVKISGDCEERDFSENVDQLTAYQWINDGASFKGLMALYFPEKLAVGECGPWKATISEAEGDE